MQPETCPFTRTERLVLQLIADGKGVAGTAYEMALSHWTVRSHLKNARNKVKASNITHMAVDAVRKGWVL